MLDISFSKEMNELSSIADEACEGTYDEALERIDKMDNPSIRMFCLGYLHGIWGMFASD